MLESGAQSQRRLSRRRISRVSYSYELYAWGYREIAKACKEHGAIPVWVYIPRSEEVKGGRDKADQQRMAEEAGFVVLDCDGVFDNVDLKKIQVAPWDRHPNAEGHRMLGTRLAEVILAKRAVLGIK